MVEAGRFPELVKSSVNIETLPQAILQSDPNAPMEFAIGDLHASTLKLLFFWCKIGLISLSEDMYKQLVTTYLEVFRLLSENPILDNSKKQLELHIAIYREIVNEHITVNTDHNDSAVLIGDVLCDRGCLDWFTLLLNEKVQNARAKARRRSNVVLASNHDNETTRLIELARKNESAADFHAPRILDDSAVSSINMKKLIDLGLLTQDEIFQLYDLYQQQFKAIHYTVDNAGKLTGIFTHAPMNMREILNMANGLMFYGSQEANSRLFPRAAYNTLVAARQAIIEAEKTESISSSDMIRLIDAINAIARYNWDHGSFTALSELGFEECPQDKEDSVACGQDGTVDSYPFHMLVWRRQPVALNDITLTDATPHYIYGHDSKSHHPETASAHPLDNTLAKGHTHDPRCRNPRWAFGPSGMLRFTQTPYAAPPTLAALPACTTPTSLTITFSKLLARNIPASVAAAVFVLSITAFVVACILKQEVLDFMGMKDREGNIGLAVVATLCATGVSYAAAEPSPRSPRPRS